MINSDTTIIGSKQNHVFIWFITLSIFINYSPRIISLISNTHIYLLDFPKTMIASIIFALVILLYTLFITYNKPVRTLNLWVFIAINYLTVTVGNFYLDIAYIYNMLLKSDEYTLFFTKVFYYLSAEWGIYAFLSVAFMVNSWIVIDRNIFSDNPTSCSRTLMKISKSIIILTPVLFIMPIDIFNIVLYCGTATSNFIETPIELQFVEQIFMSLIYIVLIGNLYIYRDIIQIKTEWLAKLCVLSAMMSVVTLLFKLMISIVPHLHYGISIQEILNVIFPHLGTSYYLSIKLAPLFFLMVLCMTFRRTLSKLKFNGETTPSQITSNYGTAQWATENDFKLINIHDKNNGILIGADEREKLLYLPLLNKLTISPPGGGKTSASSIPVLLMHKGPVVVWDIKGELWAVTAKYRAEILKRQVIVIDPYEVTLQEDFTKGKSKELLKRHSLNPFDWIPENKNQRDRIVNLFASSLIVNEGGYATHFEENAKILIRGYIDYIMSLPREQRSLAQLHQLMSEGYENAKITYDQMEQLQGRAGAAANQINRVGTDERGSILSTSYRQIDWLGDSNIQKILSHSNFDLTEFLKGNMDIFIVLPEDQVKEQNRLVRMMLVLLMGLIINAKPSDLPKNKILILLDELAQLGYCPDVEQCIEVLRSRGVVIWTVFQTLSQIEAYKKSDLFKGMPLKQFFTTDDTKTMEWIQQLGGKKTILSRTISSNKGDTSQKMQAFGGSISKGEGESVQETGVDLIPTNEIREMHPNKQFIFLHGQKPIFCQKVRYFEAEIFKGIWDQNPLENK